MTQTAYKMMPLTVLYCRENIFTKLLLSSGGGIHIQTHRLLFDKTQTAQKVTRPTILLLCVFVAMRMCLPSCWLAPN
jgi:heme/copper-type cytochrome/quinol oxidase subunit 3